jgi:hypothetical protein
MQIRNNATRGHAYEDKTAEQISQLHPQWQKTRMVIQTPNNPYHTKVEIDNIFLLNKKLYIIQQKIRRSVNRFGKDNTFWVPSQLTEQIWYDGKKHTTTYMKNLWSAENTIVNQELHKTLGTPQTQKILLINAKLKTGKPATSIPYAKVRDTYIITELYFSTFLKNLPTLPL